MKQAIIGLFVCSCLLGAGVLIHARSLAKPQREIVVRQVSNGYVIQLRDANNPYAVTERVQQGDQEVAGAVIVLLHTKFPQPRWGK